jgi:hypothetical protein
MEAAWMADSPGIARTGVSTTQFSPRAQMPHSFSSQGCAVYGDPALPPQAWRAAKRGISSKYFNE